MRIDCRYDPEILLERLETHQSRPGGVPAPSVPPYYPEAADHVLVDYTPGGDLLAIWTMGLEPNRRDFNVVYARSMDGGVNWTSPTPIHEPGALGHTSQFGWPVISKTGRIYCFYNRTVGIGLPRRGQH